MKSKPDYEIIIEWSKDYSLIDILEGNIEDKHRNNNGAVYMILFNKHCRENCNKSCREQNYELWYIGSTNKNSVSSRFRMTHLKLKIICAKTQNRRGCLVTRIGTINQDNAKCNIHKCRTIPQLIRHVESALIQSSKPEENEKNTKNYDGPPMKITNKGWYEPLDRVIVVAKRGDMNRGV